MWRSVALTLALLAASGQAQEAPRDKLNATTSALQTSKENAEALKAKLESSRHEVSSLRENATELAADVQEAERRVSTEESRYRSVSIKLAERQKDFDARKDEYAQTLASMMRMQKMPATAMVVNPENAQQLLQTARVMQQVNGALSARAAQLRSELDALEKLRRDARASKEKLEKETGTLSAKQKQLNSDLARRQEAQRKLSKDLSVTQERVADLSKESATLQELIGKLEADRINVAKRSTPSKPLAAVPSRGRWKLPVAGNVVHRFGERKNANETYRGIELAGRPGAAVVAPAAGEVVFTGPFRDYGRMVLVKHGNDRISLLAGLGNIAVTLNQSVGAGEPLGSMGSNQPALYYELREGGKPIDPSGWFANLGPTFTNP